MKLSIKLKKVLHKLGQFYFPFNHLSNERLQEILNHIRIIELQQDEILQIKGGDSQDYLYLIEGQIDVVCDGNIQMLTHPEETQRRPVLLPDKQQRCSILARDNSIICHAKRDSLDTIIAWDYIGRHKRESLQYIDIIRNTLAFGDLPAECVEKAFSQMQSHTARKGECIQSNQCDAFYLIKSGSAEVQQFNSRTQDKLVITTLSTGDIFGNAAQISGKSLDETVVMLEDCELMVLSKQDYKELIHRPIVKTVQAAVAKTMLDNGYQLLDVRFAEEYAEQHISGSQLIPLEELSKRINNLNKKQPYIVYCHSGPRSAVAAMLLSEKGFEALSLEGGIRDWPFEVEHSSANPNVVSMNQKFH